jgi:uncharacterized protein involved in type VI secretion and phage assembly
MIDDLNLLIDLIRSRRHGKYRGTVVDNADPSSRGRLKVRCTAALGDTEPWAMPCVPYAGPGVGLVALPPVGAGVWVEFEGGDPSYPIWVGCYWADHEAPEQAKPDIKIWRTEKLTLRLDDAAAELQAASDDGARLTLTGSAVTEAGVSKHTVDTTSVTAESGAGKVAVGPASVSVNNGALEVR